MKSASGLAKDSFKDIKPCSHGADVFEATGKTGLKKSEILDFSSNVNPLGPSLKALEMLRSSLSCVPDYPDSDSNLLRQAIANHYGKVSKNNIVVGNGSTELIYLFTDVFIREGDVALIPAPSFSEYERAVKRSGGTVKHVELGSDFQLEPDDFMRAVSEKVKAIFLCNPNNPTSILCPTNVLEEIINYAFDREVLVFLDEDFLEFVKDEQKLSFIPRIRTYPNLFILRSFTKIYGLTGLRVGYGVTSQEIAGLLMNAKIPWNVNCLGQAAAVAALKDRDHLGKTLQLVNEEKAFLFSELSEFKALRVYPPDANYFFINIQKSGLTSSELKSKMLDFGVLIRDCGSFACLDKNFVRIAVKTHDENLKLLEALKKVVK